METAGSSGGGSGGGSRNRGRSGLELRRGGIGLGLWKERGGCVAASARRQVEME